MDVKKYYLSSDCHLKWLEKPFVYHMKKDELYELDENAFAFLKKCLTKEGCHGGNSNFINYCMEEGIFIDKPVSIRRPQVKKSPIPSLRYLELQLTDRCNLRCNHCYIGPSKSKSLDFLSVVNLLKEFEEMQGLRLLITGGEPLLYHDFLPFNKILPEYGFRKVLFTNGLLLNQNLIDSLHVHEIQISIDGLKRGHEAIRGKGTYGKAMTAIELAMKKGFEVSVSTMIHSHNLDDFGDMERMFREMGIKDWTVDVPCIAGYLRENPDLQIPPEVAGRYLRYGFGDGLHGGGEGYACGLHLMSVLPDGRAAKCAFYSYQTIGHINEGLERCWKRNKPIRLEELKCDCKDLDACRGGCRYRAETLGDPLGKDLYRCHAMKENLI